MTGVDYAAQFPKYTDEAGALALLAAHGGVEGILTTHLGEPMPTGLARDGDVVTARFDHGITAGVQLGVSCYFAASLANPGLAILSSYRRGLLVAAWRI